MSNAWWSYYSALSYVLANYPLNSGAAAADFVDSKIEDGTLSTRYHNEKDGKYIPINRTDWKRYANGSFRKQLGWGDGEDRVVPHMIELRAAEVQRLCAPKQGAGGRPPKDWDAFYLEVIKIAAHPDGLPSTQAELESRMLEWCVEKMADPPGDTSVRERVRMIYQYVKRR